ncbi:MAG TPA: DNA polymerase III subunit beta [Armatimonadota bacterium]|jgi:DNA polymerase-3 subunit beta
MKIIGIAGVLAQALQTAKRGSACSSTLPILHDVLLQASDDSLQMTCTDLRASVSVREAVTVLAPGAVAVRATMLLKLLRSFPRRASVTLSVGRGSYERDWLTITHGPVRFALPSQEDADEFPALPDISQGEEMCFPPGVLAALVSRTSYAMSDDESRCMLCGISVERSVSGGTVMVANDSHRLAAARCAVPGPETPFIIPATTVRLLPAKKDCPATLQSADIHGTRWIAVACGNVTVVSRTVEGTYPAWRRVMPAEKSIRWTVNPQLWLAALRRALLVTGDSRKVVHKVDGSALTLTAEGGEYEQYSETIPLKHAYEPHEVAFNAEYLIPILTRTLHGTVLLYQNQPTTTVQIDDGSEHWANIVMPMSLV